MHEKILTYLNLALILVSGGCIYFLATADYTKPLEIRTAEDALRQYEREESITTPQIDTIIDGRARASIQGVGSEAFKPFYTPTPTPTPTASPTPAPPRLEDLVYHWKVAGLNPDSADFIDTKNNNEFFTLKVGGPPRMGIAKDGTEHPVTLESVDFSEFKAILRFGDQTWGKAM
jgi:hypothetical protein